MRRTGTAFALASLLLLAGCSGGKETEPSEHGAKHSGKPSEIAEIQPIRKEFMMVREIVKQHALQQGNEKRMAAIEAALTNKFPLLPDKGATDEEKRIYREAEELSRTLSAP